MPSESRRARRRNTNVVSFTNSNDQFTSYVQPTITGIIPNSGPVNGGYYVAVAGTNFIGTTGVKVGDVVTAFQVLDNQTLSVYIPGSDSGLDSTSVSVTSPGWTSPNTTADQFTYTAPPSPPAVAISRAKGRPGKKLKVTGANFAGSETVTIAYLTGLPSPASVTICTGTASAGAFTCKGTVPGAATAGAPGLHFIIATGTAGDSASTAFNLK